MVVGLPISPLNGALPLIAPLVFLFFFLISFALFMEGKPFHTGTCFLSPIPFTPVLFLFSLAAYHYSFKLYDKMSLRR